MTTQSYDFNYDVWNQQHLSKPPAPSADEIEKYVQRVCRQSGAQNHEAIAAELLPRCVWDARRQTLTIDGKPIQTCLREFAENLNVIPSISAAADEEARLLYDRKSAARQLSISLRSLDALIANKRLDTRRIGSRVLIPRAVLVKFARADHPEPIQFATDMIQ